MNVSWQENDKVIREAPGCHESESCFPIYYFTPPTTDFFLKTSSFSYFPQTRGPQPESFKGDSFILIWAARVRVALVIQFEKAEHQSRGKVVFHLPSSSPYHSNIFWSSQSTWGARANTDSRIFTSSTFASTSSLATHCPRGQRCLIAESPDMLGKFRIRLHSRPAFGAVKITSSGKQRCLQ